MAEETFVILTRHGETIENRQNVLQGHLPGHLTNKGKLQAHELAKELKDEIIDVIICSDLARSYDTALIIANKRGLIPISTKLLREKDWGVLSGKHENPIFCNNTDDSIETSEQLYKRAGKFLNYLLENYHGKHILVIGHGCINMAITAHIRNIDINNIENINMMDNGDIFKFKI